MRFWECSCRNTGAYNTNKQNVYQETFAKTCYRSYTRGPGWGAAAGQGMQGAAVMASHLELLSMVVLKHVHFSQHQLWTFQVSTSKEVGRTLESLLDPCGPRLDVKFCISKTFYSSYGSCVPSSLTRHPQNPAAEVLPWVLSGHVCGLSQLFGV